MRFANGRCEIGGVMNTLEAIKELYKNKTKVFETTSKSLKKGKLEIQEMNDNYKNVVVISFGSDNPTPLILNNTTINYEWSEIKQLTEGERLLYSLLNNDFKWIATDENGKPYAYKNKPHKTSSYFRDTEESFEMKQFSNIITQKWEEEPLYVGDIERRALCI